MLSFLFSPITRLLGGIMAVLAVIGAIYGKGRRDARQKIEGEANAEALRRTQNAIDSGNRAASGELRADDGHKRRE
jgi:hypothetical protein